jgi:CheY-like chemotaxis protein
MTTRFPIFSSFLPHKRRFVDELRRPIPRPVKKRNFPRSGDPEIAYKLPEFKRRLFSITKEVTSLAQVLVIDDDSLTCRTLARLIRAEGHAAVCVFNAAQATESLAKQVPQLLVLDVMLPDETGIELLRKLRKDPRTKDVPVILYTAVRDDAVRAEAKKLGAPDFVVKGGGWNELLPHIAKYVGGASSSTEC